MVDKNMLRMAINTFGLYCKGLPDPFSHDVTLPVTLDNFDSASDYMGKLPSNWQTRMVEFEGDLERRSEMIKHTCDISDYGLASLLANHDLRGLFNGMVGFDELYSLSLDEGDVNSAVEFIDLAIHALSNVKYIGMGMAFLSDSKGATKFESSIDAKNIEKIFLKNKRNCGVSSFENSSSLECFSTSAYSCGLYQFAKNARSDFEVRISDFELDGVDYVKLSLKDYGPGLYDLNAQELVPTELAGVPLKFSSGSSKEDGGLGLHVAKRCAQKWGGFAEVISKTKGRDPLIYRTNNVGAEFFDGNMNVGTEFSVYVPKSHIGRVVSSVDAIR